MTNDFKMVVFEPNFVPMSAAAARNHGIHLCPAAALTKKEEMPALGFLSESVSHSADSDQIAEYCFRSYSIRLSNTSPSLHSAAQAESANRFLYRI